MINKDELTQQFKKMEGNTKRRNRTFYLLGLLMLVTFIVITVFYINTLARFEKNRVELISQTKRIDSLKISLEEKQVFMEEQEIRLSALEARLLEKSLNEEEKKSLTKEIINKKISRQYVSLAEKDFLAQNVVRQSDDFLDLYLKGLSAYSDGYFAEAERSLTAAIELQPDAYDVLSARGIVHYASNEYHLAIDDFDKSIAKKETAEALAYRGFSKVQIGMYEQGVLDCTEAIDIDSTYWVGYHYRAFANYFLHFDFEAISDWERAAELQLELQGKANSLENISLILIRNGQWREVIENTERVRLLNPASAWNWFFRSVAAAELGKEKMMQNSRAKWDELKTETNIINLKKYFPLEYADRGGQLDF